MASCFEIVAEDKKTKARTGRLKTAHGVVETPMFMPVATKMTGKYICIDDFHSIGAQAIIVNGFITSLSPGTHIVKKSGGIHKFMNFHKTIFTDSGGFQLIKSSFSPFVDYNGIKLKSPFDGRNILLTPESAIKMQCELGSDVAMCLDDMPPYVKDKSEIKKSVDITRDWATRCKKTFEHIKKNNLKDNLKDNLKNKHTTTMTNKGQLLFGIIQGGVFKDLREESAKFIDSLDFDGIAIGGFGEGETPKEMLDMVMHCERFIDKKKPRYLMGIGSPELLLDAIACGVDCFDSVFPTQNGRRNTLFTWEGKLRITNKQYEHDLSPLDKNCDCFVCKSFTRAYLHHLASHGESSAKRYLSYHNVYFIHRLVERARCEIAAGTYSDFMKEMKKKYEKNGGQK
ncbi:MAG: tRNA guanosine(34) transglycosylase Tgt [Nanoarchaeota archaeon]|nr:tRNA guanosine(34) transglycosylase Tgt [Nanoarchaeota archaeon]